MRESVYRDDLIIKKGNQRLIGLAASPNGYPLRKKWYFDTTPCSRCKGFIREREAVPMVQAFAVSPVRECEVMGARICGAVF